MALMTSNYKVIIPAGLDGDTEVQDNKEMFFRKVSGLKLNLPSERIIDRKGNLINVPGRVIDNITFNMERGFGKGLASLYSWFDRIRKGELDKKDITVQLFTSSNKEEEAIKWTIYRAFPTSVSAPDWSSEQNELAIETVEMAAEDMKVEFPE